MSEIQKIALSKALAMLQGAGAKYIVVLPTGEEHHHGDLKLAPQETARKRVVILPMGTYKKVYEPILKSLQVGNTAFIPCPEGMTLHALQSAATAWCCNQWGKGSAMSHCTGEGVEIMRIA
jgi:hypothetical protein